MIRVCMTIGVGARASSKRAMTTLCRWDGDFTKTKPWFRVEHHAESGPVEACSRCALILDVAAANGRLVGVDGELLLAAWHELDDWAKPRFVRGLAEFVLEWQRENIPKDV